MRTVPLDGVAVRVLLFGRYRDIASGGQLALELPNGATVSDLVAELHAMMPGRLPDRPTVAVNRRQALDSQILEPNDEIALIPPVAGG